MRHARVVKGAVALVLLGVMTLGGTVLAQRGFQTRRNTGFSGNVPYDGKFVFVRMAYAFGGRRDSPWAHDYPFGERNFMTLLTSISNVAGHTDGTSIMTYGDPEMFKFPVIYMVEPGYWHLDESEIKPLRDYLLKGGFLIVDDFPGRGGPGGDAWPNFDYQMSRVFPTLQWVQLDVSHPIFHTFFEINTFDIIPQAYNLGGRPAFYALFEDNDPNGRMLAIANYQNDLSEFWEASDQGYYLVSESNEAYKIGVNQFIYGMTR